MMELDGEENRIPFYSRMFYELGEEECLGIESWLRKEAGPAGSKWRSNFMGLYYVLIRESDVGCVGNLSVDIFDPSLAFQFELFKIGGHRTRERKPIEPSIGDFEFTEYEEE